jgi:predicted ribosome quality control (RQC) complex YloA/Tae2 family protein
MMVSLKMKIESIIIKEQAYKILIGRNAKDNEQVIKISNPNDIWLHFANISSPHIILQSNGNIIPKRELKYVALLLFKYKISALKNEKIIYTEIRNISLTKITGTVLTKNTKVLKM